jgi:hypothetical protein
LGVLATSNKLEDRVEGHYGDARPAIEIEGPNALDYPVDDRLGPIVTVVEGIAEQRSIGIQQSIIDSPRVDANRIEMSQATCGTNTVKDSPVETQHVPTDMTADRNRSVPEPVDLSELEVLLTELGDEYSSIRGAEVHGYDACCPAACCGLCSIN